MARSAPPATCTPSSQRFAKRRLLPADLTDDFLTPQVAMADGSPAGQALGLVFNDLGYYKEGESEGASGIFSHPAVRNADIVILSNTMDGTWPLLDEFVRHAREAHGDKCSSL